MNKFTKVLGAASLLLASASASASMINVGGVFWDPDAATDFSNFSLAIHQDIDAISGVVSGFGSITTLNSTGQSDFCPGCELTFTFDGFTPIGSTLLPDAGVSISYSGGFVNVYVDDSPELTDPVFDPDTLTYANTSDGDLWLSLVGHVLPSGSTFTGATNSVGSVLTGSGLLDVVGGLAVSNLDTDTKADGFGGFADFTFTNSFTSFPDDDLLDANGTGNFKGDSIPEPASLALLGIGLLGFGARRRLKK